MARLTHQYRFPDRFVAGTVGEPGSRTFYLQARDGNRLTSVLCEKEQVRILAEHLERILDELAHMSGVGVEIPPALPASGDLAPLDMPLEADFRAGTMTLAWDTQGDCVAIELFSAEDGDSDESDDEPPTHFGADIDTGVTEPDSGESLEVRLTPHAARDFIARSLALVSAGRPACPFCQQPMDAGGHICPRANGYRRALFE